MFDFGLTQPCDGGFVALTPEVLFGEVEWIVVFDFGVGFNGEGFKVCLGLGELRGAGLGGGGGEGCC